MSCWTRIILVVLVLAPVANAARAQYFALGKGSPPLEPYDQNFSYLADPAARSSFLDEIHYLPIGTSGAYVTFDAELREQFWSQSNMSYALRTPVDNTYDLQRLLASVYIHLDPHFAAFVQIGRFDSFDRIDPSSTDRDEGRVQQGFVELKEPLGTTADVTVRAGRQELVLGSARFVWLNDSSNVRTTNDGVRVNTVFAGGSSADFVYTRPDVSQITPFDDFDTHAGVFGAAYFSQPAGGGLHIDEYYFYRRNIGAQYSGLSGNEDRSTIGGRLWGALGSLKYDADFAYQFGSFNDLPISAFGGSGRALYTLATTWEPGLQLQASYFSGGGGPDTHTIRTFSAPLPRPTLLNYIGIDTLENLIEAYPAFVVNPTETLAFRFGPEVLWRASVDDAVYISRTTPLSPTMASNDKASYIGTNLVATGQWVPAAGITVFGEFLHELPGPAITLAGGKAVNAGVLQVDFRL